MVPPPAGPDPEHRREAGGRPSEAQLTAGLKRLASDDGKAGRHLGSRIRNAFLTGLVIVGPVTITLWIMWGVIHWIDAWIGRVQISRRTGRALMIGIGVMSAVSHTKRRDPPSEPPAV